MTDPFVVIAYSHIYGAIYLPAAALRHLPLNVLLPSLGPAGLLNRYSSMSNKGKIEN